MKKVICMLITVMAIMSFTGCASVTSSFKKVDTYLDSAQFEHIASITDRSATRNGRTRSVTRCGECGLLYRYGVAKHNCPAGNSQVR